MESVTRTFFDTNIFIYAEDARDPSKQRTAQTLLIDHISNAECVISTQVINEFCAVSLRKMGLSAKVVRQRVLMLKRLPTVVVTTDLAVAAIELSDTHSLSYWDALMVAAAKVGSCDVMLSEDMQHGAFIGGVRIRNPFVSEARETPARYRRATEVSKEPPKKARSATQRSRAKRAQHPRKGQ